ncbi:MAG: hypothetical protein RLZZ519_338 [Bacteroidota bacterium]
MKRLLTLLVLLLLYVQLYAQPRSISLHAGIGFWSPRLNSEDFAYSETSGWKTGTFSIGSVLDFAPNKVVSFAPALDLELYRRKFRFTTMANYELASDQRVLYLRASPGIRFRFSKVVHLRIGFSVQALAMASGPVVETEHWSNGSDHVSDYSNSPRKVLAPVTFGPDAQLNFQFPLGNGGALAPGIHTYFSLKRSGSWEINLNPWIWQNGIQLGYILPNSTRRTHGFDGNAQ